MARPSMERVRRRELIGAAIEAIHECGSLDVTVGQIAKRAGVSSALAHHYFGGKEDLILASMRHLLSELGADVRRRLASLEDGRERAVAIVRANIGERQFAPEVVSAWLVFYVLAQSSSGARRLLRIYQRRLQSNLAEALARRVDRVAALRIAEGAAAMIDGLYLRRALRDAAADPDAAAALIEDYIDMHLSRSAA